MLFGGFVLKVIYVKEAAFSGYLKIGIFFDGEKRSFFISAEQYKEIGEISVGDYVTREVLSSLEYCDTLYRATLKAMRILSYGDNSERMLKRKLKLAGFSSEITDEVTEKMLSLGYINAARQLDRLVSVAVNTSNLGKRKILPKLIAKGYTRADIEKAIERLVSSGEIDFSLAMQRLRAKLPEESSDEEIKKYLYKFGHNVCLEDL